MRDIEINGKKYPFIISAANAEKNAEMAEMASKEELNTSQMINQYARMVHMGLKDGRLALPFWTRLGLNINPITRIPSMSKLKRIIPFDEMLTMVNGESYPQESEPKEEVEVEKKH